MVQSFFVNSSLEQLRNISVVHSLIGLFRCQIPPPPPKRNPFLKLYNHSNNSITTPCKFHKGRKGIRPMGSNADCFLLPRLTHAPYALKRSGNHGSQREQAKAEWNSLFCLQISFVLARFWSIEPLKILWYQSKRKWSLRNQVDFCKYNWSMYGSFATITVSL